MLFSFPVWVSISVQSQYATFGHGLWLPKGPSNLLVLFLLFLYIFKSIKHPCHIGKIGELVRVRKFLGGGLIFMLQCG